MFAPTIAKPETKAPARSTNSLARQHPTLTARPFGSGAGEQGRMLQRTIGNQATIRYPTQQLSNPPANAPGEHHAPEAARGAGEAPSTTWDFSKIPVFPPDRARTSDLGGGSFFPDIGISSLSSPKHVSKSAGKGGADPETLHGGSGVPDAGATSPVPPVLAPSPTPESADAGVPPAKVCVLPSAPAWSAGNHVMPRFVLDEKEGPRSNSKPSTTDTDDPTFAGNVAADTAKCLWHYQLASVSGDGRIRLVYFTADHYPAPTPNDDSGDLSNITKTNYKAAVDDLTRNKEGVPDFWSAYRRESPHEHYHWEVEWQGEVKKGVARAESRIEALTSTPAAAATVADADKILAPQASKIFGDEMKAGRTAYNNLGDAAGDPPYKAQAPAIMALVARINALAAAKKW
jgi:hypothetical protein